MNHQPLSDGSTLLRAAAEDDARGQVHGVALFPGLTLLYIDIQSHHWPGSNALETDGKVSKKAFLLNYSLAGSCKVRFDNDSYILQKQGDLSLSGQFTQEDYFYPEGSYKGIEFLVDPAAIGPFPEWMGLDFAALTDRYDIRKRTKIGPCPSQYQTLFSDLWAMYPFGSEPPVFPAQTLAAIRLEVLGLFQRLQFEPSPFTATRRPTFRSPQLRVAEETARLLREDLRRDWTLPELAEEVGISDSSLKRYFQSIYGCSVASYQRNARMERAAELLRGPETRAMSVLDVALEVGYENQSKFAAAFKRAYGESPLEYKKNHII